LDFATVIFLKGKVVSLVSNPQPGGPGLYIYVPQCQGAPKKLGLSPYRKEQFKAGYFRIVLRRILGPKREVVTGNSRNCLTKSFITYTLHQVLR
jgi:hypothetical protein